MQPDASKTSNLVDRLLAGDSLDSISQETRKDPFRLVMELGEEGLVGEGLRRPALVREAPLHPKLLSSLHETSLARLFPRASRSSILALSAGLLLIHDFWDESHEAAQLADDLGERSVSAYWHGIAHRREPDPGNASYWFRRVGKHPIFEQLAEYLRDQLSQNSNPEVSRLIETGSWNPYSMIQVCVSATAGSELEGVIVDLQREEMRLLLKATVSQIAS